jgi:hypothetical protein
MAGMAKPDPEGGRAVRLTALHPNAAVIEAHVLHGEPVRRRGERRERDDGDAEHDGSNKPTPAKPHAPQAPLPCADAMPPAPSSKKAPCKSGREKKSPFPNNSGSFVAFCQ